MPMNTVEDCIDKYVSLFIIYNSLYDLVPRKIFEETNRPVTIIGNKITGTQHVRNLMGASNILLLEDIDTHIENLIKVLELGIFNINLTAQGEEQTQKDKTLLRDLNSNNPQKKSLALLEIMYYIRCNIVHGRKGLQPIQTILLAPVISILEKLNVALHARLCN